MYKDLEKERKYRREWEKRNRQKRVAQQRKVRQKKRAIIKRYRSMKGCARCGIKHPACLHFHHYNDDKEHNISTIVDRRAWKTVKAEIAKCEVLCANCHAIEHWS